jgi:hypothetical protein
MVKLIEILSVFHTVLAIDRYLGQGHRPHVRDAIGTRWQPMGFRSAGVPARSSVVPLRTTSIAPICQISGRGRPRYKEAESISV